MTKKEKLKEGEHNAAGRDAFESDTDVENLDRHIKKEKEKKEEEKKALPK